MATEELVLASGNPGKLAEVRAFLQPLGYRVRAQSDYGDFSPPEDGESFAEHALSKARYVAARVPGAVLADDSGLCVDYLHGAPGIYSARYAGTHGDAAGCNRKLLAAMRGVPRARRQAHFWCALCLTRGPDDPCPVIVQAAWHGEIALEPAGSGGFGYDPIFFLPQRQLTAAQLPPALKNLLSHRARALRALTVSLERG